MILLTILKSFSAEIDLVASQLFSMIIVIVGLLPSTIMIRRAALQYIALKSAKVPL
jgi:hypothetical protein